MLQRSGASAMNASDLNLPTQNTRDNIGFDVWVLTRILIGSAAVMTFVTFSYILT
jgi:hypothetical protein